MLSFLSANISNHHVVLEIYALNETLREKIRENEKLIRLQEEIYLDTIRALAAAIDAKDPYTRGHSERVAKISVAIARSLRLPDPEVQAIQVASLLHDVGKIATERVVLTKATVLDPSEERELQRHPRTSYDILSQIRFPYPEVAKLAAEQHGLLLAADHGGRALRQRRDTLKQRGNRPVHLLLGHRRGCRHLGRHLQLHDDGPGGQDVAQRGHDAAEL